MRYLGFVLALTLAACAHAPGSGPAGASAICVARTAKIGDIFKGSRYDHASGTQQPYYFEVAEIAGENSAAERAFGGLVMGTACPDGMPVSAWARRISNDEAERRLAASATVRQ